MMRRLWVKTPLGAIFDEIYFVLCNFRSVTLHISVRSDRSRSGFLLLAVYVYVNYLMKYTI